MAYTSTATRFPNVRQVVAAPLVQASDGELASVVQERLGVPAEMAESFLGTLGSIGSTLLQRAPAIASGAAAGAPFGGLPGALVGGVLGGLTGGPPPSKGPAPVPAGPAPRPGTGAPAAGALLSLLNNPDMGRALMSMLLGRGVGREDIEVAGERVPPAEFVNLVRQAADQALEQYGAEGYGAEDLPEYLAAERRRGNDVGDPFVRGVVLAKLLDQPTYVPVTPAPSPAPTVVYPPASGSPAGYAVPATAPGAPAPGSGAAGAPAADPYAFEPVPTYTTPDLGIGQPIPTQAFGERAARARRQYAFEQSLEAIFDLPES